MTTRTPSAASVPQRLGVDALIGSAMARSRRPLCHRCAMKIAVAPSCRSSSAWSASPVTSTLSSLQKLCVARARPVLPSTVPIAPLPVGESKSVTGVVETHAPPRPHDYGAPADAHLPVRRSRRAAEYRLGLKPAGRHDGCDRGLALRQRAGLVDDERVDLLHALQRLGILDQDAACAPRPTPTMIDMGVARPSAHGHAMISTATAATSRRRIAAPAPKLPRRRTPAPRRR